MMIVWCRSSTAAGSPRRYPGRICCRRTASVIGASSTTTRSCNRSSHLRRARFSCRLAALLQLAQHRFPLRETGAIDLSDRRGFELLCCRVCADPGLCGTQVKLIGGALPLCADDDEPRVLIAAAYALHTC